MAVCRIVCPSSRSMTPPCSSWNRWEIRSTSPARTRSCSQRARCPCSWAALGCLQRRSTSARRDKSCRGTWVAMRAISSSGRSHQPNSVGASCCEAEAAAYGCGCSAAARRFHHATVPSSASTGAVKGHSEPVENPVSFIVPTAQRRALGWGVNHNFWGVIARTLTERGKLLMERDLISIGKTGSSGATRPRSFEGARDRTDAGEVGRVFRCQVGRSSLQEGDELLQPQHARVRRLFACRPGSGLGFELGFGRGLGLG